MSPSGHDPYDEDEVDEGEEGEDEDDDPVDHDALGHRAVLILQPVDFRFQVSGEVLRSQLTGVQPCVQPGGWDLVEGM